MRFGLFLACLVLGIGSASAAPVTYNFTGTITQVGDQTRNPPAINDPVIISITVEQNFPGSAGKDSGFYFDNDFDSEGPSPNFPDGLIVSALFNGENADNVFEIIVINRKSDITFRTTGPQISAGFDLMLSGARGNSLNKTTLPSSLNANDFTFGTFARTFAISPQYFGYSGVINGLYVSPGNPGNAVPEPASMAILGVSMLGMLLVRRKR